MKSRVSKCVVTLAALAAVTLPAWGEDPPKTAPNPADTPSYKVGAVIFSGYLYQSKT